MLEKCSLLMFGLGGGGELDWETLSSSSRALLWVTPHLFFFSFLLFNSWGGGLDGLVD